MNALTHAHNRIVGEVLPVLFELFEPDQDMTFAVFCINKGHANRHLLVSELDPEGIVSYLRELEADLEEQRAVCCE